MSDAIWYYVGSFGQLGPLTKEQVEELIESRVIERETYVWKAGFPDWTPAGGVVELDPAFKLVEPFMTPPPPPSASGSSAQTIAPPSAPYRQPDPFYSAPAPNPQTPPMGSYGQTYVPMMPADYQRRDLAYSGVKSPYNRSLAGILQFVFPGVGRIYMGYAALGVLQMLFSFVTCGVVHVWSMIDGILILSGKVHYDGYGRRLDD